MRGPIKVLWLSPPSIHGENIISVWARYMKGRRPEWEIDLNPEGEDYDLIFSGSDSQIDRAIEAKKKIDAPILCYFWGWPPFRMVYPRWQTFYSERLKSVASADMILSPSYETAKQLMDFGIPSWICPPGVDNKLINSVKNVEEESQAIYVGRLEPHKRVELAILGLSMTKNPPKFVIVGSGSSEAHLKQMASSLSLNVEFKGLLNDEEKIKEIKKSMYMIFPSSYEGLGVPALEALYCSKCVIVSDLPVFRETLLNNALYFGTLNELRAQVEMLFGNRDLRKKLGEVGCSYVERNFTMDIACIRLEQVMEHVVKTHLGAKIRSTKKMSKVEWQKVYDTEYMFKNRNFETYCKRVAWRVLPIIKLLKPRTVLDIGCESGEISIMISQAGFEVVGVDCSEVALRKAEEYKRMTGANVKFTHGFAERLEFPDESFDSVFAGELLEHVGDPDRMLSEIRRVLKKNGVFVATTPVGKNYLDPLHLRFFTRESLFELVKTFFETVKIERVPDPGNIFIVRCVKGDF